MSLEMTYSQDAVEVPGRDLGRQVHLNDMLESIVRRGCLITCKSGQGRNLGAWIVRLIG